LLFRLGRYDNIFEFGLNGRFIFIGTTRSRTFAPRKKQRTTMGACGSRERNASLTTTWAEVTAPEHSREHVQITEQRRSRPSEREAATISTRSENALQVLKYHKNSKQRQKTKKKKAVTRTEDDKLSLNTHVTTANSPKSIIIPEITENSSSSDDEMMMDEMISEESKGGRAVMQRIDPNQNIEPETYVVSNGLTHTRAAVGTSTTLRPPHRRRKSKSRGNAAAFPIMESRITASTSGPPDDIAYQPNDPNSTAILRRFLSPVTKTKVPPPPKAACFTQVHTSLTQSPIQEDDDSPPPTETTVPFTTPSKRGALTRSSSSSAPSDEETDPTIPNARVSRRRNSNNMEIGRLSPIKLKTSTCVSPQSIRVYYDTSPPQESNVVKSKSDDPSVVNEESKIPRKLPDVAKTEDIDEAVPALAVTNFSKLQLQVAVAAKHSLKQRVITKIDDRLQDVQQHRQLWDEYHAIQKELQKPVAAEVAPPDTERTIESSVDAISSNNENPIKKEETVTSVRRRRRRRFLHSKRLRDAALSEVQPPVVTVVEYDMEDDISVISKHKPSKSPKKSSTRRATTSDQASTKTSETNPKTPRQRRQRASNPPIVTSESSTTSQPSKEHKRVSSFDLHETQTWFFDFQEEFVLSAEPVAKGSTTIVTPTGELISNVGKVKSQSDLSLLSASSLEVQRQLYAEKRRLRKMKQSSGIEIDTALNDDTPPIRNGPRLSRYSDGLSTGSARSDNSNTSYDYGPTRRRLLSERHHPSGIPAAGSAQQILEASTEEEKLRIAREILKMRSVTHMEVAFTSKSVDADAEDTGSFVSDLDETSSFTSLANSSYASNNDYGVKRRIRRSFQYQAEDENTDDPSVVSEVSLDLSQTKSVERKNRQLGNANVPVYDFQSIVQRRLDIEERLRALMVEEMAPDAAAPEAARVEVGSTSSSGHVVAGPPKVWSLEQKSAPPMPVLCSNVVSPDVKPLGIAKEGDVVESVLTTGPESKPHKPSQHLPMSVAKGKSDFSRLLDAVLVNRPIADHGEISCNDASKGLPEDAHQEPTKSCTDESNEQVEPISGKSVDDVVQPSVPVNPLFVIDESFESNESKSQRSDHDSEATHDHITCDTSVDNHIPCIVSPDKDEFLSSNRCTDPVFHNLTNRSSDSDQLDGTHETLLLADQVALSVNDILERYRSVV
jgi:hypothetical protein